MLRTTPESLGEQLPWKDPESGLVITADARIDNREELFGALGVGINEIKQSRLKPLPQGEEVPDSWLILEAFKRWGEACVDHLLGDFAFAIWDSNAQKLFCARDPMGAASFCFVHKERFFAFASEAEALVTLPGVSNEPNENYIACVLVPGFENFGDSKAWQKDVGGLNPGESMSVAADGSARRRTHGEMQATEVHSYDSYEQCEEHFNVVFGQAVRDRLRSAGDVAAMMSGGLDSAGIVAMMDRLSDEYPDRRFHSYSAIGDDPKACIESRCINSMAESLNVDPNFVSVPSFSGMVNTGDLKETAWSKAHPVDNSILLPAMMCLAASRNGQRVLLQGVSGDMTMRAPDYYPSLLLRKGRVWRAWQECKAASRHHLYVQGQSPLTIFRRSTVFAAAPPLIRRWVHQVRRNRQELPLDNSLLNPGFVERIQLRERLRQESATGLKAMSFDLRAEQLRKSLVLISSGLSGYGRVAARNSVEVRDPWADRRVMEFFLRLPVEYKIHNGWTKYPVRSAFRHELTQEVRWRHDKRHLGWQFISRLMAESRELVHTAMTRDLEIIGEYVDIRAARSLHQRMLEQGDDASTQAVFDLVTLIFWLIRIKSL
jgi:asparagine synthase (glutamine-hydrolysing)